MTNRDHKLAILSMLPAIPRPGGKYGLIGRLISGFEAHRRYWDGECTLICEASQRSEANADRALGGDNVDVDPRELPFDFRVMDFQSAEFRDALSTFGTVGVGLTNRTVHLHAWARKVQTTLFYTTEYTLQTQIQIIKANTRNPILRARRIAWAAQNELRQRWAIKGAAGIQCNGVPTFEDYKGLNPNALLYFESRLPEEEAISADALEQRLDALSRDRPLRLVFSGRLNKMKGADQLVDVAAELRRLGVRFTMDVFGGGVCEPDMRREIERQGLEREVRLGGYVDFEQVLVPHLARQTDLFVCPHPQGDPASVYMETLAMGVPIVGYDNEAFSGILGRVEAGEAVRTNDTRALAKKLAELDRDRSRIQRWARTARAYARDYTFLKNFELRMAHCAELARLGALAREGRAALIT